MENRKFHHSEAAIPTRVLSETTRATLAQTLTRMRHDVRTPMHVVSGLMDVLSASDNLTPQQKEIVAILQTNAQELLTMVDDILDLSQSAIKNLNPSE